MLKVCGIVIKLMVCRDGLRGRHVFPFIGFFLGQVEGSGASSLTSAECAVSGESRPYMYGDPWVIPGYIEAEYYDYGGNGVSD